MYVQDRQPKRPTIRKCLGKLCCIKFEEMRCATNGTYPVIAVWENVMGAFSSNNRLDFKAVLESFTNTEIPMPASGDWEKAGMVRGNNVDIF